MRRRTRAANNIDVISALRGQGAGRQGTRSGSYTGRFATNYLHSQKTRRKKTYSKE
jgi:hypothetical protein